MDKYKYIIGEYRKDPGDEEERFHLYNGPYENAYDDEQEAKDVLVILRMKNENLVVERIGPPVRMEIDLSQVKDIRELD